MRLKLIACKALFRELSYLSALSENAVDATWIRQGCHDHPEQLKEVLQHEIDLTESGGDLHTNKLLEEGDASGVFEDFDAILIGYGLCSNGTLGLSSKKYRLVIPKAHDCITLFLGSKERYARYFKELPGCFWYTASWIENTAMPGKERAERSARMYREMGYDEETIEYLLDELSGVGNYRHSAYIPMPFLDRETYRAVTQEAAEYFGWDYHEIKGDMSLMERFIAGKWDPDEFLVLEPGERAEASYDSDIIKAVR